LQDARLPCDKRMAYAVVGGGLDAEPTIRFSDREGSKHWICDWTLRSEGSEGSGPRMDSAE